MIKLPFSPGHCLLQYQSCHATASGRPQALARRLLGGRSPKTRRRTRFRTGACHLLFLHRPMLLLLLRPLLLIWTRGLPKLLLMLLLGRLYNLLHPLQGCRTISLGAGSRVWIAICLRTSNKSNYRSQATGCITRGEET